MAANPEKQKPTLALVEMQHIQKDFGRMKLTLDRILRRQTYLNTVQRSGIVNEASEIIVSLQKVIKLIEGVD